MADTAAPTKMILDFTNVKDSSGVNPVHRPAGDYRVKLVKVEAVPNKKDPSITNWVFHFTPTDMQSATYPYYCVLQENQLWKVRNLLIACGLSVPKKKVNVDPNKLVGREIGVTLDDDEYEGKMKSVITALFPASDLEDDDATPDTDDEVEEEEEVEEEPAPVARKAKAKPAPAPAAEVEDEVTEDDMDELEVEDL